jgi:hypothetical protein
MALEGRVEEAAGHFRQARAAFHELELPWLEGLSALDAAYSLPADHPEASEARAVARRTFEALGARALIDQLDELERRARGASGTAGERQETPAGADAVRSEAV